MRVYLRRRSEQTEAIRKLLMAVPHFQSTTFPVNLPYGPLATLKAKNHCDLPPRMCLYVLAGILIIYSFYLLYMLQVFAYIFMCIWAPYLSYLPVAIRVGHFGSFLLSTS